MNATQRQLIDLDAFTYRLAKAEKRIPVDEFVEGYRSARADHFIGWRSEVAFAAKDCSDDCDYYRGYREGFAAARKDYAA